MRQRWIHLIAASTLLLQSVTGFAQVGAHLSPHEPTRAVSEPAAAALPCHGEQQQSTKASAESGGEKTCCAGSCDCAHACGAATALPAASGELDDFISAHFEALRSQPAAIPAHTHKPPRPPAPQG